MSAAPEPVEASEPVERAHEPAETAPLVIGGGEGLIEEDSTGEHEVPAGLVAAFEQQDTAPGSPVEEAPRESWREALEDGASEEERAEALAQSVQDKMTFSDLSGAEIGKRVRPEDPLTPEQVDAIIIRTARLYQKRPEELGAVTIQQIAAREFQLGPQDVEQVIDALGVYQREAKRRGLRGRLKLAAKYSGAVLLAALMVVGVVRGKAHMEQQYETVAVRQYYLIMSMQQRRQAINAYGLKATELPGKAVMEETKQQLVATLKAYDEAANRYNDHAQTFPISAIVWFFELPPAVTTSRDINGLYMMGL